MTRAELLRELRPVWLALIFAAGLWTWRLTAVDPVLPDPKLYPPAPFAKVAAKDGWARPRALIEGRVTRVSHEADGDWHIVVVDPQDRKIICEEIPELRMASRPRVGDVVQIWGRGQAGFRAWLG